MPLANGIVHSPERVLAFWLCWRGIVAAEDSSKQRWHQRPPKFSKACVPPGAAQTQVENGSLAVYHLVVHQHGRCVQQAQGPAAGPYDEIL